MLPLTCLCRDLPLHLLLSASVGRSPRKVDSASRFRARSLVPIESKMPRRPAYLSFSASFTFMSFVHSASHPPRRRSPGLGSSAAWCGRKFFCGDGPRSRHEHVRLGMRNHRTQKTAYCGSLSPAHWYHDPHPRRDGLLSRQTNVEELSTMWVLWASQFSCIVEFRRTVRAKLSVGRERFGPSAQRSCHIRFTHLHCAL